MKNMAEAMTGVFAHGQEEVNPRAPEDYTGKDGLLRCGKCHGYKQWRVTFNGKAMIVPAVCSCREAELQRERQERDNLRKTEELPALKSASLMPQNLQDASFARYIRRPENEKAYAAAKTYAERFSQMYASGQGLLLYGAVGAGKSYTAACIANALMEQGVSAVMTSFVSILREFSLGSAEEERLMRRINAAKLLILDDLGAERSTDYAMEKVYAVIDSRVRTEKPMILTTNLTMEFIKNPNDIRYTRIYDRILRVCYPVQMIGRSFRLEEAGRRFAKMNRLLGT